MSEPAAPAAVEAPPAAPVKPKPRKKPKKRKPAKKLAKPRDLFGSIEHKNWKPLSEFRPFDKNPRAHPPDQVEQIAASLGAFGWTLPILEDESGEVIAGHGRLLAAHLRVSQGDNRFAKAPYLVARGWTEEQKRAYRIADNQLALNSSWDKQLLGGELLALKDLGFDLRLTGFDDSQVVSFVAAAGGPAAPSEFPAFGEGIATNFCCPSCGYRWSGNPLAGDKGAGAKATEGKTGKRRKK